MVLRVVRAPEGDGRTKAVRDARANLEAAGKTVVTPAEYDRIIAMRGRLLEHPTVRQLLKQAFSPTELSIVWDADGLLCKARLDLPVPSLGVILDIKTARDARPPEFEKAIFTYGYARQAAHYLDGAEALARHVRLVRVRRRRERTAARGRGLRAGYPRVRAGADGAARVACTLPELRR